MGSLNLSIIVAALLAGCSACADRPSSQPTETQEWQLDVAAVTPPSKTDREWWLLLKNSSRSVSLICWNGWAVHYGDDSEFRPGKADSCEQENTFQPILPGSTVVFRLPPSQLKALRADMTAVSVVFDELPLTVSVHDSREIRWTGSITDAERFGASLANLLQR
jgi:hypothetical protein